MYHENPTDHLFSEKSQTPALRQNWGMFPARTTVMNTLQTLLLTLRYRAFHNFIPQRSSQQLWAFPGICLGELGRFSCSLYEAEEHWPRVYPAVHTSFSFTLRGGGPTAFAPGAQDREDHPKLREGDRAGQVQASRSCRRRKLSGHFTGTRRTRAEARHWLSFWIFFRHQAAAIIILKHFWSHCNVQRIFQLVIQPPLLHLPRQRQFFRFSSSIHGHNC